MRSLVHKTLLGTVLLCGLAAPLAWADGFIRHEDNEKASLLQTAVTQFKKGEVTVDLIGVIHIADADYYAALNKKFESYDRLLFEMIGGDVLENRPDAVGIKNGDNQSALMKIYNLSADFLKLVSQVDAIDYRAKNFVHADLTLAEFKQMQKERKETLVGFAFEAGMLADDAMVQPNSYRLLAGILRKDANVVKRELLPVLAQGDEQMGALEDETVILTDRNKRCLEVVAREAAAGHKKLGVFYGAAHMPDLVKRLQDLGYKQVGQEWMTAWAVPKEQK